MKIEFDLNRPVEWQFHPAALDKGVISEDPQQCAVLHRDTGLSFVFSDDDCDEKEIYSENRRVRRKLCLLGVFLWRRRR